MIETDADINRYQGTPEATRETENARATTRSCLLFPFVLEESEKKFVLWDTTDHVMFTEEPLLCESQFPQYTTRCYILVVDVC
jgi:hypothetical protein